MIPENHNPCHSLFYKEPVKDKLFSISFIRKVAVEVEKKVFLFFRLFILQMKSFKMFSEIYLEGSLIFALVTRILDFLMD